MSEKSRLSLEKVEEGFESDPRSEPLAREISQDHSHLPVWLTRSRTPQGSAESKAVARSAGKVTSPPASRLPEGLGQTFGLSPLRRWYRRRSSIPVFTMHRSTSNSWRNLNGVEKLID